MSGMDDLTAIVGAFGLRIERENLEQWAPILHAQFEDLARMVDLPIDECEPAFIGTPYIEFPAGGAP